MTSSRPTPSPTRPRRPTPPARPRPIALYRIARAALAGPCRLPRGSRLLVACSGGPDSLALLHVLVELARPFGLALAVAHLDHGQRGRAGRADARFVAAEAGRLGLPAVVERAPAGRRGEPPASEATLRRRRHAFYARAARATGADAVALGHTADDQAETVLLRLARGTGPLGLAAMRPRRGRLLRPLLAATRADVMEFVAARRLKPRRDASNRDPSFRRNYVRAEILPRMARLNPRIAGALAALAGRAAGLADWLQQEAAAAVESARSRAPEGQFHLVARKLLRYHPIVREAALTLAFRHVAGSDAGLTRRHLDALQALLAAGREGSSVALPGSRTARIERGRVCFSAMSRNQRRRGN